MSRSPLLSSVLRANREEYYDVSVLKWMQPIVDGPRQRDKERERERERERGGRDIFSLE